MSRPVLSADEVARALADRDSRWELVEGRLLRTVVAPTFLDAIAFVNEVAQLAERANHHPDIDIRYTRLAFTLVTHDSDGVTQADLDLAAAIDGLGPPGGGSSQG